MYSSGVNSRHSTNRFELKPSKRKFVKKNQLEKINESLPTKTNYLNSRLRINISGKLFEVPENILNRYPLTILGCYEQRMKFYDCIKDEFFFDRNREAFEGKLFLNRLTLNISEVFCFFENRRHLKKALKLINFLNF